MFVIFIIAAAAAAFFLQWSRKSIVVTEYTVESEKIPGEFDGFSIVQVSDLQSEYFGKGQKNLLKKVRSARPDIIVFTGDLADRNHTDYRASLTAVRELAQIAPVYYVNGNHELALPQEDISQMYDAMKEAGVHLLLDDTADIVGRESLLHLAGLSEETLYESKVRGRLADEDFCAAAFEDEAFCAAAFEDEAFCAAAFEDEAFCAAAFEDEAFGAAAFGDEAFDTEIFGDGGSDREIYSGREIPSISSRKKISDTGIDTSFIYDSIKKLKKADGAAPHFSVLLVHEPQFLTTYAAGGFDLIFAGHAHGGQIRLPFTQGLFAPGQGILPRLTAGVHTCGETKMVISRGLGNSTFPFRVFNRPEIVSVKLTGIS